MVNIAGRAAARRPDAAELARRLIGERERTARLPGAVLTDTPRIVRDRANWVRCLVDHDQLVERAADGTTARRIWMVQAPGRRHAYHAIATEAGAAFEEADEARERRRAIGRRRSEIRDLRRDVLLLRRRYFTTVDDARAAGLCELGIRGFLARVGHSRRGGASAFVLALASFFDRQPGYAMLAAHLRLEREDAGGREAGSRARVRD